jgi:hypothetical protein
VAISCTLVYLAWKTRREIPFSWMFLAFGLFIVACGFTHFMEVVVLWKPLYWLAGDVKLVTALASVVTAVASPGLVPEARKMVLSAHVSEERRQQLESANAELLKTSARILAVQDSERGALRRNCFVRLVVEDAGKGFTVANGEALKAGVGIASMRERVRELGGELYVRSSAAGTIVEAKVPLPPASDARRKGRIGLKPPALA